MRRALSRLPERSWCLLCGCVLVTAVWACGAGTDRDESTSTEMQQEQPVTRSQGVVDPAKIQDCGGFTVQDAAELLGVSVDAVVSRLPEAMNGPTLKTCAFEDAESGRGISFSLTWADTATEMAEQLADERELVGVAQASIDTVSGSESEGPASYEIDDIGEEAFFAAVNGTVVARVANVRVQVLNAPDLDTRKRVAAKVADRLR
jgi:hypothetical protein